MPKELIFRLKGAPPDSSCVKVVLSPFSVFCDCQAAMFGLPCKHRITILQGGDPGIIEGDKSKLADIKAAADGSGVFDLLKNYETAKEERKAIDGKADKAFKKYRDARLALLQKKVKTERAIVKARDEMEAAIDAIGPAAEKTQAVLAALRGIFKFAD